MKIKEQVDLIIALLYQVEDDKLLKRIYISLLLAINQKHREL